MNPRIVLPLQNFKSAERMYVCGEKWQKPCMWDSYDSINVTSSELDSMLPQVEALNQASWADFLKNPALLNFVMSITNERTNQITKILFKKSIMLPDDASLEIDKDISQANYPCIDAYVSFHGGKQHEFVLTLGYISLTHNQDKRICTFQNPIWIWHKWDRDLFLNDLYWQEFMRTIKIAYIAIQKAIADRPTIFSERQISRPIECSSKKKKKSNKRKVRVIRVLRINQDELTKYTKTHRKIECPCWGVMGHWRSYKSGKKVWIAPYRKGRERDNPEAYSPKEYQLEEVSVCK